MGMQTDTQFMMACGRECPKCASDQLIVLEMNHVRLTGDIERIVHCANCGRNFAFIYRVAGFVKLFYKED